MNSIAVGQLLIIVTSLLHAIYCSADTYLTTITVQDRSAPGSPMSISGTVELRETVSGDTVQVSVSEDINSRNISEKIILALVVWIDIAPPRSSPKRFVRQYECFFAPDVIKPGDEHPLSQPATSQQIEPYDPNRPTKEPRAEVRVMYVQFVDGSVFGHEAFGAKIQSRRRVTWQHLRHLEKTYVNRGAVAFVELLNERVEPPEVDTFFENIRETLRRRGVEAAIWRIRASLQLAAEREAGFRPPKTE